MPRYSRIGNLPFGYRTHEGKADISSVIVEHLLRRKEKPLGLALILPDSLAYTKSATNARQLLRTNMRLEEITRLPEGTFEESAVQTLVLTARLGTPTRAAVVREVRRQDLALFRSGSYVSRTYVSPFSSNPKAIWLFSPFSNLLERAAKVPLHLGDLATVRIGLQVYGKEDVIGAAKRQHPRRALLTDPASFARWGPRTHTRLANLNADPGDVRRQGPWDLFARPKVIVRSTTFIGATSRLAAIPDTQGVWFTDKFVGIWPRENEISINAIAAYLQSDFVTVWYATNNPSRKLRVRTLEQLPVPSLTPDWWNRAARLAVSDRVIRPNPSTDLSSLPLVFEGDSEAEWDWFNTAVNTALGIDPASGAAMREWLTGRSQVANVSN